MDINETEDNGPPNLNPTIKALIGSLIFFFRQENRRQGAQNQTCLNGGKNQFKLFNFMVVAC